MTDTSSFTLPEMLRVHRAFLHCTQQEAARAVGVHPQTWSLYERGMIHPSDSKLRDIKAWIAGESVNAYNATKKDRAELARLKAFGPDEVNDG